MRRFWRAIVRFFSVSEYMRREWEEQRMADNGLDPTKDNSEDEMNKTPKNHPPFGRVEIIFISLVMWGMLFGFTTLAIRSLAVRSHEVSPACTTIKHPENYRGGHCDPRSREARR